jgi:TRAP transporter TAXI family solute receptor
MRNSNLPKGLMLAGLFLCLVLTGISIFPQPARGEMILKVATGAIGGNWFPLGAVVCTIINEKIEGVKAAPTLGGGVSNLKALNAGKQDLSITNSITDDKAWNGEPPFEKKYRNVRGAWMIYPEISHIFVTKESGIQKVEDLKGKRVSPMYKGATGNVVAGLILKEYGMSFKDFSKTVLIAYSGGADLMKDKHLDAYMITTMAPSAPFLDVCTFMPTRIIAASPEVIKRLIEKYPAFTEVQIPGGTYPGNPDPLNTFGYKCGFTARKDLPDDLVYKITKEFWTNYKVTHKVNPSFSRYIKPENALKGMVLPLHAGAYKYYKEAGYEIPKKLMPID